MKFFISRHAAAGTAALAMGLALPGAASAQAMLTHIDSPYPFAETVQRIEKTIAARGLVAVAKVDHAAAARQVGLEMRPTLLLIFGNPKGGTPLMQAHPSLAIDLPLKALVAEGADGKVKVSVNGAALYKRHGLSDEQAKPFAAPAALVGAALQ